MIYVTEIALSAGQTTISPLDSYASYAATCVINKQ